MRKSVTLLATLACFGLAAATGTAAAQEAWPPPGLTCRFDYVAYVHPAGAKLEGAGSCVRPDGSLVDARVDGHTSPWGWACSPGWTLTVSSGDAPLLSEATWYRTPLLPGLSQTGLDISSGPVTSPLHAGQGSALSLGTDSCGTSRSHYVYNATGVLILSFIS